MLAAHVHRRDRQRRLSLAQSLVGIPADLDDARQMLLSNLVHARK